MPNILGIFKHKEHFYSQILHYNTDDRIEILDENENVVLTFTADSYIVHDDKTIGRILHSRDDKLYFTFQMDEEHHETFPTDISADEVEAYVKAEIIITKYFLDNKVEILKG